MRRDGVSSQSKSSKRESNRKWTERKYHVQIKDDVRHFGVKMGCSSEMFPELPFADLTKKHHGARGLGKHYHFRLDPKLGQGKCAIRRIPCACDACMEQLDKKWISGKNDKEQPRYADVPNCVYADILGSFNRWNIITFSNKETEQGEFDEVNRVVLDGIANHMCSLIEEGKYGAVGTTDKRQVGYYVV